MCWDSPNVQCVLTMLLAAAAKQVSTLGDRGRVAVALAFEPPNFIVLEVSIHTTCLFPVCVLLCRCRVLTFRVYLAWRFYTFILSGLASALDRWYLDRRCLTTVATSAASPLIASSWKLLAS